MFSNSYKRILFIVIAFVITGHFSLQAFALNEHVHNVFCKDNFNPNEVHDIIKCFSDIDLEICDEIKTNKLQLETQDFAVPSGYFFSYVEVLKKSFIQKEFSHKFERNTLSHQQLARSHLS